MMGGGMWGAMRIWAFLTIIVLLAVLVVAVLASIWLVRKLREDDRDTMAFGIDETAHAALHRGEIDDNEYERTFGCAQPTLRRICGPGVRPRRGRQGATPPTDVAEQGSPVPATARYSPRLRVYEAPRPPVPSGSTRPLTIPSTSEATAAA